MKLISKLFFGCLIFFFSINAFAQPYSNWITDSKHPELKVRQYMAKDKNNTTYLYVQIVSSKFCKLDLTASVCDKDRNDINKWQTLRLLKDKPQVTAFKVLNACTNGFWWWYKNFDTKGTLID